MPCFRTFRSPKTWHSAQDERRRQTRPPAPRVRDAGTGRYDRAFGAASGTAFGRAAAARCIGPRPDHQPAGSVARRTLVRARPVPAHPHADRAEKASARTRHHLRLCHPFAVRGVRDGRQARGAAHHRRHLPAHRMELARVGLQRQPGARRLLEAARREHDAQALRGGTSRVSKFMGSTRPEGPSQGWWG